MTSFINLLLFMGLLVQAQPQTEGPSAALGKYNLPIVEQMERGRSTVYRSCEIEVRMHDKAHYIVIALSADEPNEKQLLAGSNLGQAKRVGNEIVCDDVMVIPEGERLVSTEFILDPETKKVIRARLVETDPNGEVVRRFTCGEVPMS